MKMVAGTWCLRRSFHFERLTCSKATSAVVIDLAPEDQIKNTASATRSSPLTRAGRSQSEIEVLDIEERSLLSFQRPVPCLKDGVKKTSDSRQEASEVRIVAYTSRAWRLLWSSYGAFLRASDRTAREV